MAELVSGRAVPAPDAGLLDVWQFAITPFAIGDPDGQRLFSKLIRALAHYNQRYMGRLPRLYESGVRYQAEVGEGFEGAQQWFRDAATIYRRGVGHCPGLTAWRLAELATLRISAMPILTLPDSYHATIVIRIPGRPPIYEDPSHILGRTAA